MMTALAPIEAGTRQPAALRSQRIKIDSDFGEKLLAGARKSQSVGVASHIATVLEAVEREYAQLPGKMVIANARLS